MPTNVTRRPVPAANEGDRKPTTPHTRVPNLVADYVLPLLSHSEASCLMYVIRRTYGFASADGARKDCDRISLTQFEDGITSGPFVLDLGTGLSRPAIIKALRKLNERGLVAISRHCAKCLWEPAGVADEMERCPRCRRTLDRSYGMVPLTPNVLASFLNANDPQRRSWSWDHQVKRLRAYAGDQSQQEGLPDTSDYTERLWYPELTGRVIALLNEARRSGAATDRQLIRHVYQPLLDMQEDAARNPTALKHALEQTIARRIPAQVRTKGRTSVEVNWGWWKYTKAILSRTLTTQPVGRAHHDPQRAALDAEAGARDLLRRAFSLNHAGDSDAARAVLSELLALPAKLAPLHGGQERADALIRLAFKRGVSDIGTVRDAVGFGDFYPEWDWPDTLVD